MVCKKIRWISGLRGRQRYNSVAVGGSFNAFTNGARVYTRHDTRNERTNASLICCMSAGSDAFIIRPPASKHTPVPPLPSRGEKRPPVSPGRSRACLRTRNVPRGKHERPSLSTSTCGLERTMAAVTVQRTRGYRLTPSTTSKQPAQLRIWRLCSVGLFVWEVSLTGVEMDEIGGDGDWRRLEFGMFSGWRKSFWLGGSGRNARDRFL